jgi:hypothetical protein
MSFQLLVCAKTEKQIDVHLKCSACVFVCQKERLFLRLQFSVFERDSTFVTSEHPQNLFDYPTYVILLCLVIFLLAEILFFLE